MQILIDAQYPPDIERVVQVVAQQGELPCLQQRFRMAVGKDAFEGRKAGYCGIHP